MPFLLEGGPGYLLLEGGSGSAGALLLEGETFVIPPVEGDVLGFNADYRIAFGIDVRVAYGLDFQTLFQNEG